MLKVLMTPALADFERQESGIKRVIENYQKYLPLYDVEVVEDPAASYDLIAAHAGMRDGDNDVAHLHGMYWTAHYDAPKAEHAANARIVKAIMAAREVTVPSAWVAETIKRDFRFSPHVVPHGIDWESWQHDYPHEGYVLWNKNRAGVDVCDPTPVAELARRAPALHFVSTFAPERFEADNLKLTGLIPHDKMKLVIQHAAIYLSTTEETFGIGTLEAMASGLPILGFAHGGNLDLVEHGVNGYLARPGDYDDLMAGLAYCVDHRDALGENGREKARAYTWEKVAEQVAGIYRQAATPEPPTVSVVIPCYNKSSEQLSRAIKSAMGQSHRPHEIIVVDDGSDNKAEIARTVDIVGGERIILHRQERGGVANARNAGIRLATGKYISCLDADDEMAPGLVERCTWSLEQDPSLGLAYTATQMVNPDGTELRNKKGELHVWAADFSLEESLAKRNHVPTCNVFRRKAWQRAGGYRQRYADPAVGAGAEDAEFWLRLAAFGWGIRKVTDEPLFIYHLGGSVSGAEGHYLEPDWLEWHKPWREGMLPAGAMAKPANGIAHPVRRYYQPRISVVIPVGPKHRRLVVNTLDSLENQSFPYWEVVVVWDCEPVPEILMAYPYARHIQAARGLKLGAARARNLGAAQARGDFLLFVDADDWLMAQTMEWYLSAFSRAPGIVFGDYIGLAKIKQEDLKRVVGEVQNYDPRIGLAKVAQSVGEYDCERALAQPTDPPYVICNVTSLLPRAWFEAVGGFDEAMPTWEDVDLYNRLAFAGHCFTKVNRPTIVYPYITGGLRELGREQAADLMKYLKQKYEGAPKMPCHKCPGGGSADPPPTASNIIAAGRTAAGAGAAPLPEDMVKVRYVSHKRGRRNVTGAVSKRRYGYHQHDEQFLVLKVDVPEVNNGQGNREFQLVQTSLQSVAPEQQTTTLPPPPQAQAATPPQTPPPPQVTGWQQPPPRPQTSQVETLANALHQQTPWPTRAASTQPQAAPEPASKPPVQFDLEAMGLPKQVIGRLQAAGIERAEDVLELGEDGLRKFEGVGPQIAKKLVAAAGG